MYKQRPALKRRQTGYLVYEYFVYYVRQQLFVWIRTQLRVHGCFFLTFYTGITLTVTLGFIYVVVVGVTVSERKGRYFVLIAVTLFGIKVHRTIVKKIEKP